MGKWSGVGREDPNIHTCQFLEIQRETVIELPALLPFPSSSGDIIPIAIVVIVVSFVIIVVAVFPLEELGEPLLLERHRGTYEAGKKRVVPRPPSPSPSPPSLFVIDRHARSKRGGSWPSGAG